MIKYLHFVTIGTSIIRNAWFNADKYDFLKKHSDLLGKWARASPKSYEDKEAGDHARESSEVFQSVYSYVIIDPYKASAELNSILSYFKLLNNRGIKNIVHDIVLYPTDTGTSLFCSKIIELFLKKYYTTLVSHFDKELEGHSIGSVEVRIVSGFGIDFWTGLLNLIREISLKTQYVRRNYQRILVNLTAGFKPESGFLLLISSIIGIDTSYYIHEYMREIIEIPILELELSSNMKQLFRSFIEKQTLPTILQQVSERLGLTYQGKPRQEIREIAKILKNLGKI